MKEFDLVNAIFLVMIGLLGVVNGILVRNSIDFTKSQGTITDLVDGA